MKLKFSIKENIPASIYQKLYEVALIFHQNQFECFYVGGFIRDIILKKKLKFHDIDIATNAMPNDMMKIFQKVIPIGIKHGTVAILYKGLKFEATTYRRDTIYKDHRHPEEIHFLNDIYEDLSRRDFTINALAYDILSNTLIDEYGGLKDIENKVIRCIGNPIERFLEDGLRPIRACRFLSSLEFTMDNETKEAIKTKHVRDSIKSISIERFTDELKKGFQSRHTSYMLRSLYELNLLELFLPEENIYNFYKIPESFWNYLDMFPSCILKFSLWLWYQNFETNKICKQLRLSNLYTKIIKLYLEGINLIINEHPYHVLDHYDFDLLRQKRYNLFNKKAIDMIKVYKKYLGKIKKELPQKEVHFIKNIKLFYIQCFFDIPNNKINTSSTMEVFFQWFYHVLKHEPITIKDLSIDGNDLKKFNFYGKEIGTQLHQLLEYVLENPELNNKDMLIKLIKSSEQ